MSKSSYILGISAFYHDSSACLIKDGFVIAASLEERFSRKKHDSDFPEQSARFCLEEAGIDVEDLEMVVYYDKPFLKFDRIITTYFDNAPMGFKFFSASLPIWLKEKLSIRSTIKSKMSLISKKDSVREPKILFSSHHLSHAASAFYPSPFSNAAIICIDGVGERGTTTIWHGQGNQLSLKRQINFPHSLGLLYSAITYFCGFRVNEGEYKLMGLAPYGKPIYTDLIKENLIKINTDGSYSLNMKFFGFTKGLQMTSKKMESLFGGVARTKETPITQREMNIAASIQVVLEEVVLLIVKHAKKITGENKICLSGGVALNCVCNGKLLKSGEFEDLWIQPASSDAGSSLGAAFAGHFIDQKKERSGDQRDRMENCFLGKGYSKDEVSEFLNKEKINYTNLTDEELTEEVSKSILDAKVIGWFQGRAEFGPRALGNRSILGNALDSNLQKTINQKIKFRESFRPFAPIVLEKDTHHYFDTVKSSPYMLLVDKIKPEYLKELSKDDMDLEGLKKVDANRSLFPSVTHVNNSMRIQTVTEKTNSKLFHLLEKIKDITGHGIAINTSFNVKDEPIVNSPKDALNCFFKTDMDILVIGNLIIKKDEQKSRNIPTETNRINQLVIKEISKKEFLTFWLKISIFITVLTQISLPWMGYHRDFRYLLLCLAPPFFYFLSREISKEVIFFLRKVEKTSIRFINYILMGLVYFFALTPYSILVKILMRKASFFPEGEWLEKGDEELNEKSY